MCLFKGPDTPKLPDPVEAAPKAERTAKAPTLGIKRKGGQGNKGLIRNKNRNTGRAGISSLRIPLGKGGNLNY